MVFSAKDPAAKASLALLALLLTLAPLDALALSPSRISTLYSVPLVDRLLSRWSQHTTWWDAPPSSATPDDTSQIAWVLPYRGAWPVNDEGIPLLTTERVEELWHTVEPRHTLYWLRDRYKVSLEELTTWNPDVDLYSLEPGQQLVTWRREPEAIGYGRGTPNSGKLIGGEPLPLSDKYVVLYRHRSFGTYYAVSILKSLFDAYGERYPDAQPVIIGDLSYRTGRRIQPHLSHQSGRDVDITYPRLDETPNFGRFTRIRRQHLDAARTLWIVRQMAASGYVERIFMDYWVQRAVYQEAVAQGAPQEWLEAVFQYPRWGGDTLVQRAKGHDDHMHVRFFCHQTDARCKDLEMLEELLEGEEVSEDESQVMADNDHP